MAKVTLAKALKVKNNLAGEIAKIKAYIPAKNVYDKRNKPQLDNHDLMKRLLDLTTDLIAVKTAIAKANVPLYDFIFSKAEMAGLIEFLGTINTDEGIQDSRYGTEKEVEHIAQLKLPDVSKMTADYQKLVNGFQDNLDTANHTMHVEIPDHLAN